MEKIEHRYNTRSTRSSISNESSEKKINKKEMAFVKYTGKIKYYIESMEIAEASDSIMQWVNKQTEAEIVPIAFDMEWPFSFQTGPGKSSVLQLCPEEKTCFVFQLTKLKKIPPALIELLKHPKVRLHGVNIKNDFRKLQRDFPEINADILIENCIDLSVWCNEVMETGGRWSLERLTEYILKLKIDKNKKVRMSKWNIFPLTDEQKMYAAIDVYVGQLIYRDLEKREKIKAKNVKDFLNDNGERVLKIRKALGETFL